MNNKLMLIVNPAAGKGQSRGCVLDIIQVFSKAGYTTTVYPTNYSGHARVLAREHGSEYPIIVCIGGDGTLSDVFGGLMEIPKEQRPKVGYIPLGTANDVATSLKLHKNPTQAAEEITKGTPLELDVGSFNDDYFSYIAAFGAFTEVSYATSQQTKKALGHFAYVLEGMASLTKITPYHAVVEHDEGVIEGDFVFGSVTNSTSVAGLVKLDPSIVELNDGLFEIILVRTPKSISELNSIIKQILAQNFNNENIVLLHSKKVSFSFNEEVAWTRDGENGGKWQYVSAANNNRAVQILVNETVEVTK